MHIFLIKMSKDPAPKGICLGSYESIINGEFCVLSCGLKLCTSDCNKILCGYAHPFDSESTGRYGRINQAHNWPEYKSFCDKCFIRLELSTILAAGLSPDNASLLVDSNGELCISCT